MPPYRGGRADRGGFSSSRGLNTRFAGRSRGPQTVRPGALRASEQTSSASRFENVAAAHKIDERMGFDRFEAGTGTGPKRRIGWLCNMHSTVIPDDDIPGGRAGVDFYFIAGEADNGPDADTFKATVVYEPYFLVAIRAGREQEVDEWCRRSFEGLVRAVKRVEKEDLQMANHLLGLKRRLLKLVFANVSDLLAVRRVLLPLAAKNRSQMDELDNYAEATTAAAAAGLSVAPGFDDDEIESVQTDYRAKTADGSTYIVDVREYDVPYHVRTAIDLDIRIGKWYSVTTRQGVVKLTCLEDRLSRPDPVVLAYDIETTKLPLKFPDPAIDQIMMISYMIDAQGFLLTNRQVVGADIADFEYSPKPEFPGPFMVFNEPSERAVIERFFSHIQTARPNVIVSYNGDFFDWPFVEARAAVHGLDMYQQIGFRKNADDVYQSDYCSHLDAFAWVNRDSYLPQGSRGLKAVTVAKLGYDPDELDPELMTPYAAEKPQTLAEYSVSDAVATYYLYMKYVHPFIFSLCTILPLAPDDVLRKGTGTLCEMLLMVQAYERSILLPNKHTAPREAFWDGHLLESETYVGGHVESIEAGVFRSDFDYQFTIDPAAVDELMDALDSALKFTITVESGKQLDEVENYDQVKDQIAAKLLELKSQTDRMEQPLIYHLDVASMYPNIMTTNRLQPDSMISDRDCAGCEFNEPAKTCDRRLPWSWRGEFLPAKKDEYNMVRRRLEEENVNGKPFLSLSPDEQAKMVKKRLQDYSKRIYHKIHDARVIEREAVICQRENPFYVNTVKMFRDRRYDFKGKQKEWKNKQTSLSKAGATFDQVEDAAKMVVLYDSLQLAHKVILNSFYGYVMRKGSRWYSLEMAGVTCLTGAKIIQMARQLVERIGRPLELDTDGIWCILPKSFPEEFCFKLKGGRKLPISYPCVMLNHLVHARFTNNQYEELVDEAVPGRYRKIVENSIFFEVDGPYRAMVLPTSKEEGKNLKKRYAVFNMDGSLAELKGFEMKRRGELKLIKIFQTQIFGFFLQGGDLGECYRAVGRVADRWLDVLDGHGKTLSDEELMELIAENKNLSKTVEEYGTQKSSALTTARRLADFLGQQMIKDKGLNCRFIVSRMPRGAPVTERAVPVAIFSAADLDVRRHFLRRWLKEDPRDMDPRTIIDWDYYRDRLASVIQKLITIPAALQKVSNPVVRVPHPDWLARQLRGDGMRQLKLGFEVVAKPADIEDFGRSRPGVSDGMPVQTSAPIRATASRVVGKKRKASLGIGVRDPLAALPPVMPSIDTDYPAWLQYQKHKWAIQRASRARRRQLYGDSTTAGPDGAGVGSAAGSLTDLVRRQKEVLATAAWEVIELRALPSGHVRAFVLAGGRISAVTVVVPRRLVMDFPTGPVPQISIAGARVEPAPNVRLPSGRRAEWAVTIEMAESVYRSAPARFALDRLVGVGGTVYERGVSPLDRAVIVAGAVCSLGRRQQGVLAEGLERGFQLDWLTVDEDAPPYLTTARLKGVFVFHVAAGEREGWAVFGGGRGVVVVTARAGETVPVGRMYTEIRAEAAASADGDDTDDPDGWIDTPAQMDMVFVAEKTAARAAGRANDEIRRLVSAAAASTVAVVHGAGAVAERLSALADVAVVGLAGTEALPSVGWTAAVGRLAIRALFGANRAIRHVVSLARFGRVPVGNVADPVRLVDVAVARQLTASRSVLWWSESPLPDLGGMEKDGAGPADPVAANELSVPGTHAAVTVDIRVRNLVVGSVLAAALAGGDDLGTASVGLDADTDAAFASAAGAALATVIRAWWAICADRPDGDAAGAADAVVQHLVRWATDRRGSRLFDPRISRLVEAVGRTALHELLGAFRRVGASVVYASPHRIVLDTGKRRAENAAAFGDYVIRAVADQPPFRFVELDVVGWWDVLAWLDCRNFAGIPIRLDGNSQVDGDARHPEGEWQISAALAPAVRPLFLEWTGRFINLLLERKSESTETLDPAVIFRPLTTGPDEATIPKPFSRALTMEIQTLLKRQASEMGHPDLADDWTIPNLPSINNGPSTSPTLTVVKALMQVFSLDRAAALSVRQVRKSVLSLCHVREFASEARWLNPVPTCGVMVECTSCGHMTDLDLCVLDENGETGLQSSRCKTCDTPILPLLIEERLVKDVGSLLISWSVQDTRCSKCGRAPPSEFAEHCVCGADWKVDRPGGIRSTSTGADASATSTAVGQADVKEKLRVWGDVGRWYGFDMLVAVVEQVKGML